MAKSLSFFRRDLVNGLDKSPLFDLVSQACSMLFQLLPADNLLSDGASHIVVLINVSFNDVFTKRLGCLQVCRTENLYETFADEFIPDSIPLFLPR